MEEPPSFSPGHGQRRRRCPTSHSRRPPLKPCENEKGKPLPLRQAQKIQQPQGVPAAFLKAIPKLPSMRKPVANLGIAPGSQHGPGDNHNDEGIAIADQHK